MSNPDETIPAPDFGLQPAEWTIPPAEQSDSLDYLSPEPGEHTPTNPTGERRPQTPRRPRRPKPESPRQSRAQRNPEDVDQPPRPTRVFIQTPTLAPLSSSNPPTSFTTAPRVVTSTPIPHWSLVSPGAEIKLLKALPAVTSKLTTENYHAWQALLRNQLELIDLFEYCVGDIPVPSEPTRRKLWKRANLIVRSVILSSLSDELVMQLGRYPSRPRYVVRGSTQVRRPLSDGLHSHGDDPHANGI
ncbi:hypothetical protein NLI96_g2206 [Meripilus lineatus]|uniref:DUF4219 domain-containing protein n=1 Tax=Meripilus lineatus TaxID=2056292 RepID=A0AAD5YGS8_9APHY|nr:hypothetical protein NLI96_g2206 [Physisporinus lineatus]